MSVFQQPISGKLLKLDRPVAERFYALYGERFNPISRRRTAVVEKWISVGTFRAKEKLTAKPQQSSIGPLPKEPDADHQEKRPTQKYDVKSKT